MAPDASGEGGRAGSTTVAPMPRSYPTVLDLVGNTPLVRLQRITAGLEPTVVAKLEYLNPGGSVKDRIGLRMIEAAERDGRLKPGGTIVEPTSGNTGVGLAIAAAIRGYRCIFVMPDKMSQEKISLLRAYGAEVVICPTAVEPESPESYYSVSDRLAEEIPGGFKPDQYSNQANPTAHYETTGPEIWEQTGGELDAVVIALGTGGTVSGVARYLKEQRPGIRIVGADPEGSIYSQPDDVHPYMVEGIGEDFFPATMELDLIDDFVTVSDRDSFVTARRMAREEGLLVGGSGGTAVCGGAGGGPRVRRRRHRADADPRRRPRLPVEVLRRQLHARVRVPRARRRRHRRWPRCCSTPTASTASCRSWSPSRPATRWARRSS